MNGDSRKLATFERITNSKIMKRILIATVIISWIICIIPVIALFKECTDAAVNGVIPTSAVWGNEETEMIYGIDAFLDTLGFFCCFLTALVVLWMMFLIYTIGITVFTIVFFYFKKPRSGGVK